MGNGGLRPSRVETSTVDDFIRRRPDSKYQVERMVDAGKNVLSKYGSDKVDEMSMDEYKHYIYGILDKIPFDSSQVRDIQFIDITGKGWEQMKNDPKYEAWVVGYFKVDRSVHIPFANMPGYEPSIHTEHFGASIDEHLGQSYPASRSTGGEKDSEDWWKKRKERQEEYLEDDRKLAEKRKAEMKHVSEKTFVRITAEGSDNIGNMTGQPEIAEMSAAASFFAMIAQGGTKSMGTK